MSQSPWPAERFKPMSRKLAEVDRVICASPQYVERFGAPKTPADLAHHRCIVFTAPGRDRWPFKTADGAWSR